MKLRIICRVVSFGRAAAMGGSVEQTFRTFDLDCPEELAKFLSKSDRWNDYWIDGVEVLPPAEGVE